MKIHAYIITLACLLTNLGCNTPSTATTDDSSDTNPSTASPDPAINQVLGTWLTGCQSTDQTQSLEILDINLDILLTTHAFSDSECELSTYDIVESGVGTIQSLNPQSELSLVDLNLTISNITLTVYDPETLTSFNQSVECGFNNWQLNIPQNVTGKYCIGLNNGNQFLAAKATFYGLYAISGSLLYFGDPNTGNGSTVTARPTAVNDLNPWVKQ
jgi:hypothetical protein